MTVLKTWTSPFECPVIINVCVRLEFPEVSACAPCLRISRLECLEAGFAPNSCVLPWRGREWLVRHPHTSPAMARGHRLVFCCHRQCILPVGIIYCRSVVHFVKMAILTVSSQLIGLTFEQKITMVEFCILPYVLHDAGFYLLHNINITKLAPSKKLDYQ